MSQAMTMPEPAAAPMTARTPDEPLFEVVNGQRVELPPMGGAEGLIATEVGFQLRSFPTIRGLGKVAVEVLFVLDPTTRLERRPDAAFVSAARWPLGRTINDGAAWEVVPNLAVEVISPTDRLRDVLEKLREYFTAGVELVWMVVPGERLVYDYDSIKTVRILDQADSLDGGAVLPGLSVPVAAIFAPIDEPT